MVVDFEGGRVLVKENRRVGDKARNMV